MGEQPQIQPVDMLAGSQLAGGFIKGIEVHCGLKLEVQHPNQVQSEAKQSQQQPGEKNTGGTPGQKADALGPEP